MTLTCESQLPGLACIKLLHCSAQYAASAGGVNADLTILTRSLVRMRMPLQAFRASSHLEYDSLVLHRDVLTALLQR